MSTKVKTIVEPALDSNNGNCIGKRKSTSVLKTYEWKIMYVSNHFAQSKQCC